MNEWILIQVALSLLLLTFLLWKEFTRENKTWLVWRILASILSVASLLALALPITWQRKSTTNTDKKAVLLTEGFNRDSVDRFMQSQKNVVPVFTFDETMVSAARYQPSLLTKANTLTEAGVQQLHVFGFGLMDEEMEKMNHPAIFFHASPTTGVTTIHWTSVLKRGERFYLQGRINNSFAYPVKIKLSAFQATLDSIMIPAKENKTFQLSTIPKHTGRSVYNFSVLNKRDTLETAIVPIEVKEADPLKILIIASSPDFENKFLKNWLADQEYEVVIRTTISKNKFHQQFLNTNALNVERISVSLLEKFDVIMADASALAAISKQELITLQSAISQRKKGLIIKADSNSLRTSFISGFFPVLKIEAIQHQRISLVPGDSMYKLPALDIELPLTIRALQGTQPLVTDQRDRVFVNSVLYGGGKIILTTIPNSFNWALSGNQESYAAFWSELLNTAATTKEMEESWSTYPALPEINKPVVISLRTNNASIPIAEVEGATIHLKNDPDLSFNWSGTFWPVKEGWQTGVQLNGHIFYWYSFKKDHWKNVKAYERVTRTKQRLTMKAGEGASNQKKISEIATFPKIYFFLIFLLCNAFVWLENKYHKS